MVQRGEQRKQLALRISRANLGLSHYRPVTDDRALLNAIVIPSFIYRETQRRGPDNRSDLRRLPNEPLQARRLMVAPAADGCKRLLGGP